MCIHCVYLCFVLLRLSPLMRDRFSVSVFVHVPCMCADANKAAVAAKGGIEVVLAAMRRHEGVAGVAEQGCAALGNIAWLGGCSSVWLSHCALSRSRRLLE